VFYNPLHIYPAKETTIVSKMPYLNSVPFYSAYRTHSAELKLVPLVPRVFGQFAKEGKIDAGPMSLMDYVARAEDFEMMNYGVAVSGKAHSVLLYSHHQWKDLEGKKIGITAESSTSVELLKVLLQKKYGIKNVNFERLHLASIENDYTKYDAVLLIGDEALRRHKLGGLATFLNVYDLAEEWYDWKQMPFVFAVWTVRSSVPAELREEIETALARSLKETKGQYALVGREHAKKLGMTKDELEQYLGAFTYELGEREKAAIDEFLKEVYVTV
jgi:chorismate dehydratase